LNWSGDKPISVGGAENEGDEVQSDAGNKEAGVNNEPPVAPATKEPIAASHADTPVEPPVDLPVSRADSPMKRADAPTKKADSSVKETLVAEPSRRSTRTKKTDSPLKEPSVAEPVRRSNRARRTVPGTLAVIEEIEPLKTQFVISSDTEEEDRAADEEDSVSNDETSSDDSSSDAESAEEDNNY